MSPPKGGRKHPGQDFIKINTRNILFIAGGAFSGIDSFVQRRLNYGSIGFLAEKKIKNAIENYYLQVEVTDLKKYGLIPELLGRFPIITGLETLTGEMLEEILIKPKNALIKQYKKSFEMEGVSLSLDKKALQEIVKITLESKLGARGLRSVCERIFLDIMFEMPSSKKEIKITASFVQNQWKKYKNKIE